MKHLKMLCHMKLSISVLFLNILEKFIMLLNIVQRSDNSNRILGNISERYHQVGDGVCL